MPNLVSYEWDWESIDEHGDIVEHYLSDVPKRKPRLTGDEVDCRMVLVREEHHPVDWALEDRSWCYVDNGVLPDRFENGVTVTKKSRKQFDRFMKEIMKEVSA